MNGASFSAKRRHQREDTQVCDKCQGTGRVGTLDASSRARQRGQITYQKSLEPGAMSMRDRALKGGRPRALTLADLDDKDERSCRPRPQFRSARKGG